MPESALHLEYYDRLLRFDRGGALELVRAYLDGLGDVEGLYPDVLMPAMVHAGEEWAADRIGVSHEHYISEVTRDVIHRFGHARWAGVLSGGPVAVACCAPGERHTLGLLMIGDLLRAGGVDVHVLGEGAPAESVRDFAAQVGADVLCLSVALEIHLPEAADLIALVRLARPGINVLVGGRAFGGDPGRARAIGADHFAADARDLSVLIPELLAAAEGA
jgi:methanogenic corrinoid protein MtbC1